MLSMASDVIAIDFEFWMPRMTRPEVRCMSALSLKTGKRWDYWVDEIPSSPPFNFDNDTIFLMHFGEAEAACFLSVGWKIPPCIFDSYQVIAQLQARPAKKKHGKKLLPAPWNLRKSLVATLAAFGIRHEMEEGKDEMRQLAMEDRRSSGYTSDERAALIHYCRTDVDCYVELLPRMLDVLEKHSYPWVRFLMHGQTIGVYAYMMQCGIPINKDLWDRVVNRWPLVRENYLRDNDPLQLLYPSGEVNRQALTDHLLKNDYRWPARPTPTGDLDTGKMAFKEAGRMYPELESLRQVRKLYKALESTQKADSGVQVGDDGRARCYFSPLSTLSSRNAPRNYILGASKALRHFIQPDPGMAVASLDYSSQEFLIAGALSEDPGMLHDYTGGDVYMAFAKRIGLAPEGATASSHPDARKKAKTLVLGIGYGMSSWGLRLRLGTSEDEAQVLIDKYWSAYPVYAAWRQKLVDRMMVDGYLELADGWRLFSVLDNNRRTIMNFPMQGTGANILRRACQQLAEADIEMIGTNHDSVMIQATAAEIDSAVALTAEIMINASRQCLNGHACRVDVEQIVRAPDHWNPEAGRDLYQNLLEVCGEL